MKAVARNTKAWGKVHVRLRKYRKQRQVLRIVAVAAIIIWLALCVVYDQTNIVPSGIYALLVLVTILAIVADICVYVLLVRPGERKRDALNILPR